MTQASYTTEDRVDCQSCSKPTRGILTMFTDPVQRFRICPRCRDTHSMFLAVTGVDRKTVSITSPTNKKNSVPSELIIPPMLARALDSVAPSHLVPHILNDREWMVCDKMDGVRGMAYLMEDGAHFLGRNISKQTGSFSDKTDNLPHLRSVPVAYVGTVLDGELLFTGSILDTGSVVTESLLSATTAIVNSGAEKAIDLQERYGMVKYVVFDIPIFNGTDLRSQPLSMRRKFLEIVMDHISKMNEFYSLERSLIGNGDEKEKFYQDIILDGGEGVIYKSLNSQYSRSATSRPVSWVKRKVRRTVDAFITDFTPGEAGYRGMVGALILSVMDSEGTPVEIARVSNLTLHTREEITSPEGTLKSEYYNQVVEVSFQEVTGKSGRGRHSILERWRTDKYYKECTIESLKMS